MPSNLVKVARWLRRRAENVAVALLTLMFATFILQIFFRYVLDDPLGWSEEVIITAWLWTVLWGAAFILDESEEIRFDILYSNISENTRRIFTVLTGVALVLLYGILGLLGLILLFACLALVHQANQRYLAVLKTQDDLIRSERMTAMGEMAEEIGQNLGKALEDLKLAASRLYALARRSDRV